jgi:signal transduction histidine kinase/CheY-like chemotaxis protein
MAWQMPPDLAAAVRLGGEMGRRFAEFDWEAHPLGAPSRWPAELRAMVAVALTSRFPIVLWFGRDELYLMYNDGYVEMLGDKHPAALGRPGREVWWDIWHQVGPMLTGVVASGEATWSDDMRLVIVNEGRAQERYFTFTYGPILLGSGQIDGIFCAVAETTKRVLGERRLHVLNAVAGAAMEARSVDDAVQAMVGACGEDHPDLPFIAIYIEDEHGQSRLRAASPVVEGLLPRDLVALDVIGGEQRAASHVVELGQVVAGLSAVIAENPPRQALLMPVGEPGEDVTTGHLIVGLNPHRDLDDQYRAFLRLLADQVSAALATADSYLQQQRRADTLAELDRAKTSFLTNVSHEFRTPLTLLLGPLQDAIDAAGTDQLQRERLTMARRNGKRLLRLVNSLLEFSRIEAGSATLSPEPVDLGAVTAQVASSFAGLCERAGIDLVLDCASVTVNVDTDMWETIVLNLVSNAVKFTYYGSIRVRVEATESGGARLRVIDTGTGIDAQDLERLFERFYRARNTRGRSVEGSGIGLSLVRSLVELHDGTIAIDSELGRGTTVTIELPASRHAQAGPHPSTALPQATDNAYVAEAEQWLDQPIPQRPDPADPGSRLRPLVLIADDNADMRAHLDRILSRRWDTVVVADGQAALDAVRRHRPDLVVTDVMMPLLDGFGFLHAVRQDPELSATPVIMLSARAGPVAAGDGFAAGADDYLVKPFSTVELLHRAEGRLNADVRQRALQATREAKVRREAAMADLAAAVTAAESIQAVLDALLSGPLTASAVGIGVYDGDSGHITVHYGGNIEPELQALYHRMPVDAPVPIAHVVSTGRPMIIPNAHLLDARFAQVTRDAAPTIQAGVIHPLRDGDGAVIGALSLLWGQPRAFDDAALDMFAKVATIAGQPLARITATAREHRIATGFQDHLLDLDRSSTEAVIGAVYQPASEAMRVGGDWYLATRLGQDGGIGVCVGDVVGHGLQAATVMSNLRAAVTATALSSPDPVHVMETVQSYAATMPGARCSTLAYATIRTTTGTIDYVCAGHPYPVLVTSDGKARTLDEGRAPPLDAFDWTGHWKVGHDEVPPGSLLLLYTDGLIERRGESLTEGIARLTNAAAGCASLPVDAVCATLLERLAPPGGYTDDVVILALRPADVTRASFVTVLPASPGELAGLRHRLGQWAKDLNLNATSRQNILIATGEAVVNAIEHGSGLDPTKTVGVEAFAMEDGISISISDTGQWLGDSAASRRTLHRGRGLRLMYGLADVVDTARSPQGTTVTLYFQRSQAHVSTITGPRS